MMPIFETTVQYEANNGELALHVESDIRHALPRRNVMLIMITTRRME